MKVRDTADAAQPPVNHVRRLTAAGRGAVASVHAELSPQIAAAVLDECFHSATGQLVAQAPCNRILFGSWRGEDVVIVRVDDHAWEIHCHGGEAAVRRIMDDLTVSGSGQAGAPADEPPLESAIRAELLKARTQTTAAILLAQWQGALRQHLKHMADSESLGEFRHCLDQLISRRALAEHLTQPWDVAVIGRPNAGKSSLLNAIVGFERSIVFDKPGTTRDRVDVEIVLDGWPFRMIDTAGIRESTSDEIEASGIAVARDALQSCDACLLVVDAAAGWTTDDSRLVEIIPSGVAVAVLLNKIDLVPESLPGDRNAENLRGDETFFTSAVTGQGIATTLDWLQRRLIPQIPSLVTALPVGSVVAELCERLANQIQAGASVAELRESVRQLLKS